MTTTIYVQGRAFEMPGSTSLKYATARVTEGFGYDPEDPALNFRLGLPDGERIDENEVISDYDECHLVLFERP